MLSIGLVLAGAFLIAVPEHFPVALGASIYFFHNLYREICMKLYGSLGYARCCKYLWVACFVFPRFISRRLLFWAGNLCVKGEGFGSHTPPLPLVQANQEGDTCIDWTSQYCWTNGWNCLWRGHSVYRNRPLIPPCPSTDRK